MTRTRWIPAALIAASFALPAAAEPLGTTLVSYGATWRYLDDGSDQGSAWRAPAFVDTGWASGPAELGYGDLDEATSVSYGGNPFNKYITTWFRHHFTVVDPPSIDGLLLRLVRDDGAVVYLNGVEVFRSNMPSGTIGYLTTASTAISGSGESDPNETFVDPALLVAGDNVLAVEIHQANPTSSDISLDAELVTTAAPVVLERAPYLQVGTPTSVVVRWRTAYTTESRVSWGAAPGSLDNSIIVPGMRTEHEIPITGLAADTRYFYAVGTPSEIFTGDDADHFFDTPVLAGQREPLRIWVIGDSGECGASAQGCTDAAAVRDAYLAFAQGDLAQTWLLLGDNAYSTGTDQEYTDGFFEVYPSVMRNTVVWPAPGNHEFGASDSPSQSGPYYESFTMPTAAEAGGVPSGTEAYYSFNVANVHFVSLDSHDTDRSAPFFPETDVCPPGEGGAMYQWLCADLEATTADFVIVFWHHPPYTKGTHDSDDIFDSGGRMWEMRTRFVPVLEYFGVDLQLTGHSHAYERSYLIDGHYGFSSECAAGECFVDGGDGDPDGDGAYEKATLGPAPHEGAVYSVVGSSSKNGSLSAHPVMAVGVNYEGSMVIDVVGRQLDGYWIDKDEVQADHFRILKGAPLPVCNDGIDNDGDGLVDDHGDPGCQNPGSGLEDPQCDNGLDDDGDGKVDWDGGGVAVPDPQCNTPWRNKEKGGGRCGLGFELAFALPLLGALRRRARG